MNSWKPSMNITGLDKHAFKSIGKLYRVIPGKLGMLLLLMLQTTFNLQPFNSASAVYCMVLLVSVAMNILLNTWNMSKTFHHDALTVGSTFVYSLSSCSLFPTGGW
jgi:hypothetical protein